MPQRKDKWNLIIAVIAFQYLKAVFDAVTMNIEAGYAVAGAKSLIGCE